ncbi:MAG: cell wall metabolism sensor histidine kinase WalK [Anaerolineae bacterium]|nr:cell wall metabolism sensor histidine kinase WalK [Anaerolineae bacterium]
MFRNIRWRIAVPYLVLILLVMGGLTAYLSSLVNQAYLAALQRQLLAEARLLAKEAEPWFAAAPPPVGAPLIQSQISQWAALLNARITLIAADGTVLAESFTAPEQIENHLFRAEIQQALQADEGSSIRFSQTVGEEMMYGAVSLNQGGEAVGVLRVGVSLREITAQLNQIRQTLLVVAVITTSIALIIALIIAERTARPIRQLTQVAGRLAAGDLDARLHNINTRDEVRDLALAFNQMGDQLREQITRLADGNDRLRAVLENMADGVLITDNLGQVSLLNAAAQRLLKITEGEVAERGRSFAAIVRHHQLIELWQQARQAQQERIATIELSQQGLFVQMTITPLHSTDPQSYLIILQDLTRIRRLETVRRDFISNISHELRTPLASLRALVETLRDTALDDPPATLRFLDRAETEVDALTQMVQELMDLSSLESGRVPLRVQPVAVSDILLPSIERFTPQATRGQISLVLDLPRGLPQVLADPDRIQQVVRNLIHNALKFTPPGGQITLSATPHANEVRISVQDTGLGISPQDIPRIFERFYKSDRSRQSGGTGLGLAIARHMIQAHGGNIWVKSKEQQGSTFTFTLPVADRE